MNAGKIIGPTTNRHFVAEVRIFWNREDRAAAEVTRLMKSYIFSIWLERLIGYREKVPAGKDCGEAGHRGERPRRHVKSPSTLGDLSAVCTTAGCPGGELRT